MTRLDTVILALATERYRIDNGRWPETVESLVPAHVSEVPRDRYASGPLRLARRDHGIIIWSVGSDRVDDGGTLMPLDEAGREPENDIGFRLWDPDKRRRGGARDD